MFLQAGLDQLHEQQAATRAREQHVMDLQTGLLQERGNAVALTAPPPPPRLRSSPSPVDTPVAFAPGAHAAHTAPGAAALDRWNAEHAPVHRDGELVRCCSRGACMSVHTHAQSFLWACMIGCLHLWPRKNCISWCQYE